MTTRELISAIADKHSNYGITINPPATTLDFDKFTARTNIQLPDDL